MKTLITEFKAFALRGNVIDLAVAVVIGGAFGRIVSSLTDDIIMPVVGLLTGGIDFGELVWIIKDAQGTQPAITINYGLFINSIVIFLIVSLAIFFVIKTMNKLQEEKKKEKEVKKDDATVSKQEALLMEIRDLLKKG